jgi:hypothetical protein
MTRTAVKTPRTREDGFGAAVPDVCLDYVLLAVLLSSDALFGFCDAPAVPTQRLFSCCIGDRTFRNRIQTA